MGWHNCVMPVEPGLNSSLETDLVVAGHAGQRPRPQEFGRDRLKKRADDDVRDQDDDDVSRRLQLESPLSSP